MAWLAAQGRAWEILQLCLLKTPIAPKTPGFRPVALWRRALSITTCSCVASGRTTACPYQKFRLKRNLSGGENRYRIDALK